MSRTFYAERNCTVEMIEYVEVEADSFEDALAKLESGYGTVTDRTEYDGDYNCVEELLCYDCDRDEDDCECESSDLLASMGL